MVATRYEQIVAKFNRAKEHFAEFETRLTLFREERKDIVSAKRDSESGDVTYYVTSVPEVPCELRIVAGDALQSLRSSLDHLVWHLIEAAGNTPNPGVSGFPISDSPEKYESEKGRKIEGMRDSAKNRIDFACPYKGGNRELWQLHKLNNIDKHRLLLAMTVKPAGYKMPPSQRAALIARRVAAGLAVPKSLEMGILLGNISVTVPLQANQPLVTVPSSYAHEDVGFFFDVALNEPNVIEGVPFYLLFSYMEVAVERIINDLASCLG